MSNTTTAVGRFDTELELSSADLDLVQGGHDPDAMIVPMPSQQDVSLAPREERSRGVVALTG
jgi:hypothetical protein